MKIEKNTIEYWCDICGKEIVMTSYSMAPTSINFNCTNSGISLSETTLKYEHVCETCSSKIFEAVKLIFEK